MILNIIWLCIRQHGLEKDDIIIGRPVRDKFWKKQCKLCYKVVMLPVDEDVVKLVTESL